MLRYIVSYKHHLVCKIMIYLKIHFTIESKINNLKSTGDRCVVLGGGAPPPRKKKKKYKCMTNNTGTHYLSLNDGDCGWFLWNPSLH